MIYNTSIKKEADEAKHKLDQLINKGVKIELTEKRGKRTPNQNNYLHLLLSYYALEVGYTAEEMKLIFKRDVCPEIFKYKKGKHIFYRSTAELDTLQMNRAILCLKDHASAHGFELPDAEEEAKIDWLKNQLEIYSNYLRI